MFKWQRNFSSGSLTATIKAIIANLLICEKHCLLARREGLKEREHRGALGGAKWSATRLETVRRMCRGIIHSNQPALDLLPPDYIALAFLSLPPALSLYPSLDHCYKQLQQLMVFIALSSSVSDGKIVFSKLRLKSMLNFYIRFLNINSFENNQWKIKY